MPCGRQIAQGAEVIKCLHALQAFLRKQGVDVSSIKVTSLAQEQPGGVAAVASTAAAPGNATSAAPAPAPPSGVDTATVGKGVGASTTSSSAPPNARKLH